MDFLLYEYMYVYMYVCIHVLVVYWLLMALWFQFSDGHYISALIDALAATVTPNVAVSTPPGWVTVMWLSAKPWY